MVRMIRSLFLSLTVAAMGLPALAQPILVELFASHNCQACPKAHATMTELVQERDDVLVLTWSVDYWDYLGEDDPMAMPASSERQEAYVDRFGLRGPYTPQTVYNGVAQCAGNRPKQVQEALEKAEVDEKGVTVSQAETGGWRVSVPAGLEGDISLVRFKRDGMHDTDMVNPVTGLERLASFERGGLLSLAPDCAQTGCALLVQAPGYGPVYAVARID